MFGQPGGPGVVVSQGLDDLKPEVIGENALYPHGHIGNILAQVFGIGRPDLLVFALFRRGLAGAEELFVSADGLVQIIGDHDDLHKTGG